MSESWALRLRWPVFVLPFAVFMLVGALEPKQGGPGALLGIPYEYYPQLYCAKLALTSLTMVVVSAGYRQFRLQGVGLAVLFGVVGGALWIGLCRLNLEKSFFDSLPKEMEPLKKLGERAAYNPLAELADNPTWSYIFLAIRFAGLVLIVPIIEEFFLRGFVARYVISPDWWTVDPGTYHKAAFVIVILYGIATHPAEFIAAAAWFALISLLMLRTKSLWACVVAHALTNLILGIYVVATGDWRLM